LVLSDTSDERNDQKDYAAEQVAKLYELNPDLFTPEHAVTLTGAEIDAELRRVFNTIPTWQKFGEAWQRNSEILLAWGGDILNVYDGATTETEVRKRIVNKLNYTLPLKDRGFYMFREKMCSLLTYFLIDAKLITPIRMSPPVDFHHMRAMIGTRMLALKEGVYRPEQVAKAGDHLCQAYLKSFPEIDPVMFAELLFILSRESCANAVSEPEPDWTDASKIQAYKNTCGRCDLSDKCTHTIVTSEY
jgi:hypothetical protein